MTFIMSFPRERQWPSLPGPGPCGCVRVARGFSRKHGQRWCGSGWGARLGAWRPCSAGADGAAASLGLRGCSTPSWGVWWRSELGQILLGFPATPCFQHRPQAPAQSSYSGRPSGGPDHSPLLSQGPNPRPALLTLLAAPHGPAAVHPGGSHGACAVCPMVELKKPGSGLWCNSLPGRWWARAAAQPAYASPAPGPGWGTGFNLPGSTLYPRASMCLVFLPPYARSFLGAGTICFLFHPPLV